MHGGRVRHLLPRVPEGVPAEGLLGRALQLWLGHDARARWQYLFFTWCRERQVPDGAAVQLRLAGEFEMFGSFLCFVRRDVPLWLLRVSEFLLTDTFILYIFLFW